jgi:hypothetical protein
MNTFKTIAIDDTFDFIDDRNNSYNSFFLRCTKISPRKYRDSTGQTHQVGSTSAAIFHIDRNFTNR